MKVHQFARGIWDHQTLGCKRLRPIAPKTPSNKSDTTLSALDLKTFIRHRRMDADQTDLHSQTPPPQAETHPGGTRWNPTQEQIGILEMLYRGGTRTPNAQQIEKITCQLGKYGKIEGKNVFYWFQNHKARERQKQKRNTLDLGAENVDGGEEHSPSKRKCRSLGFELSCREEEGRVDTRTLVLFPLRPEGR